MKNLLIITLCIGLGFAAQGQEDIMFTSSKNALVEQQVTINANGNQYKSPNANKIGAFGETLENNQENFTGYSIKLLTTKKALSSDANVYYFFGDVKVEQTAKDEFHYIVGTFKSKEAASKFLETYLMQHYTSATIVEYVNGERQNN